jgi:GlpG protein
MNALRFPVTIALIATSIAASIPSVLGNGLFVPFLIASPGMPAFAEILDGEVWRLVTPMFLHFGPLHLIFNMMWLWDLGRALEHLRGRGYYLAFVLATSTASNLAQYAITGHPMFGGMSGVVYAMLGYFWMQGRFNPRAGFALQQNTVILMIGWFILCWTGVLGPIANWAHTAGLALGVAWGFLDRRPVAAGLAVNRDAE